MFSRFEHQIGSLVSAVGALLLAAVFVGAAVIPAETAVEPPRLAAVQEAATHA